MLVRVVSGLCLAGFLAGVAAGQGLAPLRKEGSTPGERKAFYVNVLNPYNRPMTFELTPMEPDFATPAPDAWVRPNKVTIAPQKGRRVTFFFQIPAEMKERKVALCVMAPGLDSAVLPRVCGTYTGRRIGGG